ncbi:MAG: hypothetical protein HYY40_03410 [Bacteroidetes bacterium]|nr:hypothetical protein [Bacteroidota bacterium]
MSNEALLWMVITEGIITCITAYFFWKVLITPPKPEPDSFTANDPEINK